MSTVALFRFCKSLTTLVMKIINEQENGPSNEPTFHKVSPRSHPFRFHECVIQKIQTKPKPMVLDKNGPRIEYSRWSGSYEAHAHSSALYQNRKNDSQTAQPTSDMVSIEFATENPDLLGVGRIPLTPWVFAPGREPF